MKKSFVLTIGHVGGVAVTISPSWFVSVAIFTITLGLAVFPAVTYGLTTIQQLLAGLLTTLLFFASILAHELAHAWVARTTVTPITSVNLFLLGGAAELVDEPQTPRDESLITLAGPSMNVALAGVFWGLTFVTQELWYDMMTALWQLNLMVAAFNFVPAFPLDGGRILRATLWSALGDVYKATQRAVLVSRLLSNGLIFWGLVECLYGSLFNGLWFILVGIFIERTATNSLEEMGMITRPIKPRSSARLLRLRKRAVPVAEPG